MTYGNPGSGGAPDPTGAHPYSVPPAEEYPATEPYPATGTYPTVQSYPAVPPSPPPPGPSYPTQAYPGQPYPTQPYPGQPYPGQPYPGVGYQPGYPPPPGYPAPGYPAPGYPGPGYPPARTNPLSTWSVVFAFLFAPVGAVLGHLALGQIKRTHEQGRDRAVLGITLSYVIIALAVVGLTVSLVIPKGSDSTSVATAPPQAGSPATPSDPDPQDDVDLSEVLLSLDDVRSIMRMPGLDVTKPKPGGSGDSSDAKAEPMECVGAMAPGIDTVYELSGATGYRRSSFTDTSTASMVEQVAASFDSQSKARSFVSQNRTQWEKCAGKQFTLSSSSSTLTFDLGTPGGTPTRVTLTNTLDAGPGVPQLRVLATRGTVVVDISVLSLMATDQAELIADRVLARIPS